MPMQVKITETLVFDSGTTLTLSEAQITLLKDLGRTEGGHFARLPLIKYLRTAYILTLLEAKEIVDHYIPAKN